MAVLKDLTAISTDPALTDLVYAVLDPSGTPADRKVAFKYLFGKALAPVCDGRLTLESGVPVSTTDQTAKTTVYFTPSQGARVGIYDGTRWVLHTFTERSLALGTKTDATNYDVFLWDNAGTLTLVCGPAWSSATARGTGAGTTELTTQDGVYVNAVSLSGGPGAKAGRYLGTIRTTATTTTEDSTAKRYVWNAAQRVPRTLRRVETTNSWTGTDDGSWRAANNSSANVVSVVVGLPDAWLDLSAALGANIDSVTNDVGGTGIGVDSTTTNSATVWDVLGGTQSCVLRARLQQIAALGYHAYSWLEYGDGDPANGPLFYGDVAAGVGAVATGFGLFGTIEA